MPRKVVLMTLTGRQLELVGQAGDRLLQALGEIKMAQQRGLELELRLQEALEIATGDPDPKTMIVDRETGEVYRMVEPGKPRKRATTKGKGKKK